VREGEIIYMLPEASLFKAEQIGLAFLWHIVLFHSFFSVEISELVESYIIDFKAYKLLVLVAVVLLASFNSVCKRRGLQGKRR
jgi:hypothetical protein